MSVQERVKEELRRFEREDSNFGKQIIGNDLTFFGRNLKDARLQLAFSLGWILTKHTYQGVDYYDLTPPPHYEAVKNSWAAVMKDMTVDGVKISYPHWYKDDYVLMTGTWKQ